MRRIFIILILLLTSCVKQEVFEPKHKTNYEVLVDFNINENSKNEDFQYAIQKILPNGGIAFFNPDEIEAILVEDGIREFFGVFHSIKGFRGFKAFSKVLPNTIYELMIVYKGDTTSAFTRTIVFDEDIKGTVYLRKNREVNAYISMENGSDSFVYFANFGSSYRFRNYIKEMDFTQQLLGNDEVEMDFYYKDCIYEKLDNQMIDYHIYKLNKEEHYDLSNRGALWDNELIPASLKNEFESKKVFGLVYSQASKFASNTFFDNSSSRTMVSVLKNNTIFDFRDSLPYAISFNLLQLSKESNYKKNYSYRIDSTHSVFSISENDYLLLQCEEGNKSMESLRKEEMGLFCMFTDKFDRKYRTDTIYFSGKNIPKEIILKLHE